MATELEPTVAAGDSTTPEPALIRQQNEVLRELTALVAARNKAATEADARLAARRRAIDSEHQRAVSGIESNAAATRDGVEREFRERTSLVEQRFRAEFQALEQEYEALRQRVTTLYAAAKAQAKKSMTEARWETAAVYDAVKHKPRRELLESEKQVNARAERLELIAGEAKQWLSDCLLYRPPQVDESEQPIEPDEDPLKTFVAKLTEADSLLLELKSLAVPRFFKGFAFVWLYFLAFGLLVYPAGALLGWENLAWLGVAGGGAIVIGTALSVWLYLMARKKVTKLYDPLCQTLLDAERAKTRWNEQAKARCLQQQAANKLKHDTDLQRAMEKYEAAKQAAKERRTADAAKAESYPPRLAALKAAYETEMQAINSQHGMALPGAAARREEQLGETQDRLARETAESKLQHQRDWQALLDQWRQGVARLKASVAEIRRETDRLYPDWHSDSFDAWTPPRGLASVIRFGQFDVKLDQIPGGVSVDPRLAEDKDLVLTMPAMLSFPKKCSMMMRAGGGGRVRSVDAIQAAMLRFMGAIPAGKLRFTIIDPVGLGQNFAGFMHLADYDELLVTHKIWTEPPQIEQRLADLTSHMANVIQKYLRNEYENIEDYNASAGEVAEPFRVLVVANFPFGFTDTAMRHLLSIAGTGARCGVYTLVSVDTKLPLPHGFRMADLEQHGIKLVWKEDRFVWKDEQFERFPLTVDIPPDNERFSKIVHLVGTGAKDANRVEVPFEFIAPPPDKWWTSSASTGVDVPLGRAGATKRQNLRLGRGTAQHVLIAGKTGSGKSTLMHALITNLALMYSPDEVELYLIDFKKGVEFKTYAQYELPHARVIAIESEREFGLSVLQRLDAELKYRGDLFRDMDVQDLNGYRQTENAKRMPRILLLIDEFQEFFVEDDKIAQDTSLLLDRLVRQGRAFGIHVHLGSQTLGGAYSLARSTLGQMAVRIALQCGEADANLILSEENSAARLLTRPGEAIYNDANGRSEGNNLFQVVWLTDEKHSDYLRRVHQMATDRQIHVPQQIVFEGNVPADVSKNPLLHGVLTAPTWTPTLAPQAWLGEAIAIKDPTCAVFRRQSGANVAMIGQQSEAALAMLFVTLVSLAAQHDPAQGTKFFVLDGQPPDSTHAGAFNRLAKQLPQPLEGGGPREVAKIIGDLAAEVERRQASPEADAPALYLCIYDLPKFRDLRKGDDDFGFGRGEQKASPAKQFATILREGPALGVHTVLWCDTLNNLHRTFDRQALREFETRVLFQMSVADSSSLIDSPQASKLGPHRALLHSEEQGRLEKFRPYSLPEDEWLAWVGGELKRRAESGKPQQES